MSTLVKWNIAYIVIVSLWAVIKIRQSNYRSLKGLRTSRQFLMFPKIKRVDADKNLKTCCKYLLNYGFYKFGVEVRNNVHLHLLIKLNNTIVDLSMCDSSFDRLQIGSLFHSAWCVAVHFIFFKQKRFICCLERLHDFYCCFNTDPIHHDDWTATWFVYRYTKTTDLFFYLLKSINCRFSLG